MPPVRHPDAPAPGELLGAHYGQCFGCGDEQPHGLHLQARAGEGVSITAEFTVQPAHQGAPDSLTAVCWPPPSTRRSAR